MKLCLLAIVRDEAQIVERMVASVQPWIDSYAIVDTGSRDATIATLQRVLADRHGVIESAPWKGFAESRNDALRLGRSIAGCHPVDAFLMMDADHVLHVAGAFPELGANDCLQIEHRYGSLAYTLPIVLSRRPDLRYEMPVHEFLTGDAPLAQARPDGVWIEVRTDGARSRDPHKFQRDAEALRAFLRTHPEHARATYYLAQSLRDANELAGARRCYYQRAKLAGWAEETWSALYEAAKLTERLYPYDHPKVQDAYLRAYNARPGRAEPLVELARWHRQHREHATAALYAEKATRIAFPAADNLFVEPDAYLWRAWDELAVNGFYSGHPGARAAAQRVVAEGNAPPLERSRLEANLAHFGG